MFKTVSSINIMTSISYHQQLIFNILVMDYICKIVKYQACHISQKSKAFRLKYWEAKYEKSWIEMCIALRGKYNQYEKHPKYLKHLLSWTSYKLKMTDNQLWFPVLSSKTYRCQLHYIYDPSIMLMHNLAIADPFTILLCDKK